MAVQTTNNAPAHVIESARENQKIEVVIEGVDRVALRYSTWTEGLGWCCQKTMRVDAGQLGELQRALTVARHRVNRLRAEEGMAVETAQVIQFPTVA